MVSRADDLLHQAATAAYQRIDRDGQSASEETRGILGFIRRHLFDSRLNVGWMLANLKLSHNVSSRFRAEMSVGLKRYIAARRLESAGRLLLDTDLEVRRIGQLVGYRRFAAFSHAFNQAMRCRPKAYRDSRRPVTRPAVATAPTMEDPPAVGQGMPRFTAGISVVAEGARCDGCRVLLKTETGARVFDALQPICDLCALEHAPRELTDFLFLNAPHRQAASLERLERSAEIEGAVEGLRGKLSPRRAEALIWALLRKYPRSARDCGALAPTGRLPALLKDVAP